VIPFRSLFFFIKRVCRETIRFTYILPFWQASSVRRADTRTTQQRTTDQVQEESYSVSLTHQWTPVPSPSQTLIHPSLKRRMERDEWKEEGWIPNHGSGETPIHSCLAVFQFD